MAGTLLAPGTVGSATASAPDHDYSGDWATYYENDEATSEPCPANPHPSMKRQGPRTLRWTQTDL